MLEVNIRRTVKDQYCITGELEMLRDGEKIFSCVTLENPEIGTEANKDLAIPAGTYSVRKFNSPKYSPKLGCDVFNLFNDEVPMDRLILMHYGNFEKNTLGCILLGREVAPSAEYGRMITSSVDTTKEFYGLIQPEEYETAKVTFTDEF